MKSLFSQVVSGLILSLMLLSPGYAGQTLDIYKATALVKNQSEAERNRAARETLGEVVVRVSGQLDALNNPQVRAAIPKAQNYLFGFSYNSTQATLTEGEKVFPAIELQLNYSPQAIEQLLREAQLPLWPAQRPSVLVWPVIKDSAGLRLELSPEVMIALKERAAYRGIPLVFPKGDTQDYVALPVSELWKFNPELIQTASLRYKADTILVARFTPSSQGKIPAANYEQSADEIVTEFVPRMVVASSSANSSLSASTSSDAMAALMVGPWTGDWQLLRGDEHRGYTGETPELGGLHMQIADDLADEFAQQYAITPNSQGSQTIYLQVGRVNNFAAFKQCQAYLGGLAVVKKMDVVKVDAEGLLVSLSTEGDLKLLVTTLALGKKLQPADPSVISQVLSQANLSSNVVSDAEEAALAAELDAEIERQIGADANQAPGSAGTATVPGSATNPIKYVWL